MLVGCLKDCDILMDENVIINKSRILYNLRVECQDNIKVLVVEIVRNFTERVEIVSDGRNLFFLF